MRPVIFLWLTAACGSQQRDGECAHSFYADLDRDGHGEGVATATGCVAPPGYETTNDDCDDTDDAIHPGAVERCNGIDDDCDGADDPTYTWYADADGDGYGDDDALSTACELPVGAALVGGDCDDADGSVHPDATEVCNGRDDDCDATTDLDAVDMTTWYSDSDRDGYGEDAAIAIGCDVPDGVAFVGGDCDDHDKDVSPGAAEMCNGADDDCDALVDFDDPSIVDPHFWYEDADADGYGDPATELPSCADIHGRIEVGADCDDADAAIHPDAAESCNVIDDDCDGLTDDDDPGIHGRDFFYFDGDGDGLGDVGTAILVCFAPADHVDTYGDCDDTDATLGLKVAGYFDDDGDGYGLWSLSACGEPPDGWVAAGGDCDDARTDVFPGAVEICDEVDDNCDGLVDGDDPLIVWTTFYADADRDGFGDDGSTVASSCDPPFDYVAVGGDCADDDPWIYPEGPEYCDGKDNDCSGSSDELVVYADWYADDDGDGYGDESDAVNSCDPPEGYVLVRGDCDDGAPTTSPDSAEICVNSVDDDCDGVIDPCPIDDADFSLVGPTVTGFASLGFEVAAADLNADGIADLIVGAPDMSTEVYVALGPASGNRLWGEADLDFSIAAADTGFGDVVAAADADGDGNDDLLLGAPDSDEVYLFLGPLTAAADTTAADTSFGTSAYGVLGTTVEILPDCDGDGVPDVAVNASRTLDTANAGSVYVMSGSVSGAIEVDTDATYTYDGAFGEDELGASIAAIGDTTGDGIADLAIGAPGVDTNAVFVVAGGEAPGDYAMRDATIATLSSSREDRFGQSIEASDYDSDGYADLFVTAPTFAPTIYAFLGALDADRSIEDADVRWIGEEGLGFSIATGGDVDADGHPDVLLGAYEPDHPGGPAAAYLQLGQAEGVVDVADLLFFPAYRDNANGYALAFVPDWTGDGGSEVALGIPFLSDPISPSTGAGRADVVFSENLY